jgi:iron complex transport system substrate-binding protein
MRLRRAVSLVPSATDALVALGAGEALVGISSDCDQPDPGRPRPVVTRAMIDPAAAAADPAGADLAVRDQLEAGGSLYHLDVAAIVSLAPQVVFAQDHCTVCAVPSSEVTSALADRGLSCEVVSLDPVGLEDVLFSFARIGRAVGAAEAGEALESSCRRRLASLGRRHRRAPATRPPRVVVLDWVDPPFVAGNWVPELVEAAGGEAVPGDVSGRVPGRAAPAPSRQVTLQAVVSARPDLVVVAPCGLGLEDSTDAARVVAGWFGSRPEPGSVHPRVAAFDGRLWFSRPGPRLVEGAEALSALLNGERPAASEGWREVAEITEDREDDRSHRGAVGAQ